VYVDKPLFHRVILTSGTDFCEWATIGQIYGGTAYNYARELGRQVGCDPEYGISNTQMVNCIRMKHFDEIVNASARVYKMVSSETEYLSCYTDTTHTIPINNTDCRKYPFITPATKLNAHLTDILCFILRLNVDVMRHLN
jgi:hypothetical protein